MWRFQFEHCEVSEITCFKTYRAGKTVKILTVGKKGRDVVKRDLGEHFVDHIDLSEIKSIRYTDAQAISKSILERFTAGEFDVATLFYSKFVNVVTQIPTAQRIIPASVDDDEETNAQSMNYEYEPSEEEILADLLPGEWVLKFSLHYWRTVLLNRVLECLRWIMQRGMQAI